MRRLIVASYLLLKCSSAFLHADLNWSAWDLSPWFGRTFEFFPKAQYRWQRYHSVETSTGRQKVSGLDHFVDLSLQISPWPIFDAGIALSVCDTKQHHIDLEDTELLVRYQLLDDIVGDSVSAVIGARVIETFSAARYEPGIFNRGSIGGELLLSVGREWSQGSQWLWRIWALGACGCANVGKPWWRSSFTVKANYDECYHAEVFVAANGGCGRQALVVDDFRGYGLVDYSAVDCGGRLHRYFEDGSDIAFMYMRRLYARNTPCHVNQLVFA
jgi:hypothetical protein